MLYHESKAVVKYLHLVHQQDFVMVYNMKQKKTIQIGGMVPFLLTVSSMWFRHQVMSEWWDLPAASMFSHPSKSVKQGQRGFLYASFTLQTSQFSSFPGLSKRVYESHLLGFSDVTHSCAGTDD